MIELQRFSPSAERNRDAILEQLKCFLPTSGRVLEVASGTGQHVVHFAAALPLLSWFPSDADSGARQSVDAWVAASGLANIEPAVVLDVMTGDWPAGSFDAVYCANMIHIAPWACTVGLLRGVADVLVSNGSLVLYGPFIRNDVATAPGNLAFDVDLRSRNPAWGVRKLEAVVELAKECGLVLADVVPMPANNLIVRLLRT